MRFFGGLADQSPPLTLTGDVIFLDTKVLLWGYKLLLWDTKNVLDIFGGQGASPIVQLFLTFWKVKSGKGWGSTVGDPKSSRKSSRKQQHKQQKEQHKQQEKISTNNRRAKAQAASKLQKRNKEHQTEATQESSTKKISTSSSKSSTNNS